jgi:hypothetical protein
VDVDAANDSFTYDANGNLTADGTRTFEWDVADRLVAGNVGMQRSEFTYDGQQRRVRVSCTPRGRISPRWKRKFRPRQCDRNSGELSAVGEHASE